MKKLPIGITTLAKIIEGDFLYVDKTLHIVNLAMAGGYYFLSRPRRFGKSLLVDTLKQAFLANKPLFNGLYLEHNWDWNKSHPIIHFSFGGSSAFDSKHTLLEIIWATLAQHAKQYGVEYQSNSYGQAFSQLIQALYNKHQQKVVLLIDEYDKPILDVIDKPDEAIENREILKGLYGFIKDNDQYLQFVLLTGVSKFSKVSLFSGLNNLKDITLDRRYADICGYTQAELEYSFKDHLIDVDKSKLKCWYNGYNFAGSIEQKVYNPFDILLFLDNANQYSNYWFETATPTFLVKLLSKRIEEIPDLEHVEADESLLATFDVNNMPVVTLMFQTGYLTIVEQFALGGNIGYILSYPNLEVKYSLNKYLSRIGTTPEQNNRNNMLLFKSMRDANWEQFKLAITSLFATIPYEWYRNNKISEAEGFYCAVIYSYLVGLAYEVVNEDHSSQGQIDLTVKMPDKILILEFKLESQGSALDALKQIKTKNYAQKYLADSIATNKPIYLFGISFDVNAKNVKEFIWETV